MTLESPTDTVEPGDRHTAAPTERPLTRAEWRRMMADAAASAAATTTVAVADADAATVSTVAVPSLVAVTPAEPVPTAVAAAIAEPELAPPAEAEQAEDAASTVAADSRAEVPLRRRRSARVVETTVAEAAEAETGPAAPEFLDVTVTLPAATSVHLNAEDAGPSLADEFEMAARLFSFTGETPIQVARAAADTPSEPVAHVPAPRRARSIIKRFAAASFSVTVMGVVGVLAVGTTTPASAVGTFGETVADISIAAPATDGEEEIQAYVAASDIQGAELVRAEGYDVASMADLAAEAGVSQFAGTWINDPTGEIQWPFAVGVPISAQFGSSSYLAKFSTAHHGTDFTPGAGAEIHAVAGGTVRIATESGGEYGVTVVIDHIVDGKLVSSRYGHMQYGSLRVSVGDTVAAGDVIGTVGNTGRSTGAHLHLEILLGGTERVDPVAWLREHAGG